MSEGKEAEGILYRHFTMMNQELEHLRGLIKEVDSKTMRLQQALESLESKTSSEHSRLRDEMTNLSSEHRKDHEVIMREVTEMDGRLAERTQELTKLKTGFEKELAPFVVTATDHVAEVKASPEISSDAAKDQFIADMQSAEDHKVEEMAESIETEEEKKKRKRK